MIRLTLSRESRGSSAPSERLSAARPRERRRCATPDPPHEHEHERRSGSQVSLLPTF
jgi:hypothetical protein